MGCSATAIKLFQGNGDHRVKTLEINTVRLTGFQAALKRLSKSLKERKKEREGSRENCPISISGSTLLVREKKLQSWGFVAQSWAGSILLPYTLGELRKMLVMFQTDLLSNEGIVKRKVNRIPIC